MRPELEALRAALNGRVAPRPRMSASVRAAHRRTAAERVMADFPDDAKRIEQEILEASRGGTPGHGRLAGAAEHVAQGEALCGLCAGALRRAAGAKLLAEKGIKVIMPAEAPPEKEAQPGPDAPPRDPDIPWREQAACRDTWQDEELREAIFAYGESKGDLVAKILCHGACPVIEECRAFARRTKVNHGVWGGYRLRDMTITAAEKRGTRR